MSEPLYKKYSSGAKVDFSSLIAGQKAVGESFKEAIGGVTGLLDTITKKHKETNTLNMQEYLQSKIRQDGLGSTEPIDTVAIKRKFGDMVDMDALGETYATEKTKLLKDATDASFAIGSQAYDDSKGDLIKASQSFRENMKAAGASHDAITAAEAEFRSSFASKEADEETLRLQTINGMKSDLYSSMRDGLDPNLAYANIRSLIDKLPTHEQPAARKELQAEYNDLTRISEHGQEQINGLVRNKEIELQARVQESTIRLEGLRTQQLMENQNALKISESSRKRAEQISLDTSKSALGGSTKGEVSDVKNSWFNNLLNKIPSITVTNELAATYKDIHSNLISVKGLNNEDANAILVEIATSEMDQDPQGLYARANAYADGLRTKNSFITQITEAEQEVSRIALEGQKELHKYNQSLKQAYLKGKVGSADAQKLEDITSPQFARNLKAAAGNQPKATETIAPPPAQAPISLASVVEGSGLGGGTPSPEPTPEPKSEPVPFEEKLKQAQQKREASVKPGDDGSRSVTRTIQTHLNKNLQNSPGQRASDAYANWALDNVTRVPKAVLGLGESFENFVKGGIDSRLESGRSNAGKIKTTSVWNNIKGKSYSEQIKEIKKLENSSSKVDQAAAKELRRLVESAKITTDEN